MNNRTIIMIAMVAVVMMMGTASAGNNATAAPITSTAVANGTDYVNISFSTGNSTLGNWSINVTNPLATNQTQLGYDWINLTINANSAARDVPGANNSTIGDTIGAKFNKDNGTIYIHLNTTIATNPNTFNVTIKNMDNTTETATLTGLKFVAGPVVVAKSEIVNESASAVANGTDKMPMRLALRDANDNPVLSPGPTITATNLNVTGSGDLSDISSINQTTGNVTFNVTATKAGVYNVSAVCDGVTIINQTTVFVAGPAYKLAWYGDNSSTPGGNSITQYVAIQDADGNNVTWTTLNADPPYKLTVSKLLGHATIESTNPLTVDKANATNVTGVGVNYTSTFELINFTINNSFDETTTIKVQANRTLLATETSLTYYGAVDHLAVTTNKTSMYANGGNDHILVTVQLKDESDANVDSDGVQITLGADNPTLFGGLGIINDARILRVGAIIGVNTTVNGVATFTVTSTTISGSDEIDASTTAGKTGSSSLITLMPAPEIVNNCAVVNTTATIKAGSTSVITATIKDYNSQVMSGWAVTFNITSGDGTFVGESSPYTTNTVSGNASVSVTSTNVSTTIKVNVTIVDENTVTQQIGGYEQSFEVDPAAITQLVIDPVSKGLKNEKGTDATFNVTTTDAYGNLNDTVLNLNVTNSNQVLGNLSVHGSATHVNNNLSLTTSGGYVKFNFTVNSTVAASATLNVTANTLYNAGNLANNISKTALVTTSGPTGVIVSFNTTTPAVGETVQAYAQLTDPSGNALGIEGTDMTFTVVKGGATVAISVNTTNATGMATYNMTVSELGTYTVTASNATLINSSSITFAGPIVSIVATANGTTGTYSTPVNSTVTVNATAKDSAGNVATGASGTVTFLVDSASIGSAAFTNGVASITYTKSVAGTYTITTWYNATISDTVAVTFTEDATPSMTVTAAPSSVTANTSTNVVFTVTSDDTPVSSTPVSGATVTLSGVFSNVSTTGADGTVTIAVNATSTGTITVTATKTGYTTAETTVTVSASGVTKGDFDGDSDIDFDDFVEFAGAYGATTCADSNYNAIADFDDDCNVDFDDFVEFAGVYTG